MSLVKYCEGHTNEDGSTYTCDGCKTASAAVAANFATTLHVGDVVDMNEKHSSFRGRRAVVVSTSIQHSYLGYRRVTLFIFPTKTEKAFEGVCVPNEYVSLVLAADETLKYGALAAQGVK